MEKADFEKRLLDWKSGKTDTYENAMGYFAQFESWNDGEIAEEGIRLLNVMFDLDIEQYSPIHDVIMAVAAQSANGAFSAVAQMLGVEVDDLKKAVSYWYDHKEDPPSNTLSVYDIKGAAAQTSEEHQKLVQKIYGG